MQIGLVAAALIVAFLVFGTVWFSMQGAKAQRREDEAKRARANAERLEKEAGQAQSAADARRHADRVNSDPDKLRESDGFKRPD